MSMFSERRNRERTKEVSEEWKQFDLFTELFPFEVGKKEMPFSDGVVLKIDITQAPDDNSSIPAIDYVLSLTLQKDQDSIFLHANVNIENNKGFVITNIRRTIDAQQERSLPEGIGVQLYTKFLDYLQQIANSQNMIMRHQIIAVPAKGMNWHKVFDPVIREYGYRGPFSSSDEDEVYVKIYTPENKTA